jgi:hypothetical protein
VYTSTHNLKDLEFCENMPFYVFAINERHWVTKLSMKFMSFTLLQTADLAASYRYECMDFGFIFLYKYIHAYKGKDIPVTGHGGP